MPLLPAFICSQVRKYCLPVQKHGSYYPDPSHRLILILNKNVLGRHENLHYPEMVTLHYPPLSHFVSALIVSIKTALRKKQQLAYRTLQDVGPFVSSHTV